MARWTSTCRATSELIRPHGARIRRGRGRARGRGARPHQVASPTRSSRARRAQPDGHPLPPRCTGAGAATRSPMRSPSRELTRVDSSVAITLCAHTSLGTQPVYLFGERGRKREWLPRLCSGERPRRVRADRARGRLRRRQHAHAGAARRRRVGRQRRKQFIASRHRHLRGRLHHRRDRRGRQIRRQGRAAAIRTWPWRGGGGGGGGGGAA